MSHPYFAGEPLVLAHRGASGYAPDQTLASIQIAVEQGADAVELDVHCTRDGHPVLQHGDDVSENTEASGPVGDFTLDELQALDAGYRWTPDGGRSFPFRGRGQRIPTLDAALTSFPDVRFNVEVKERRAVRRTLAVIERHAAHDRVLLASWYTWRRWPAARRYPGPRSVTLDQMLAFMLLHWARLDALWAPPVDAFQIPRTYWGLTLLTPRLVRRAHRHGIRVHVWTVDDTTEIARLLEWGVDGIVTNRPDVAVRVRDDYLGRREGT